MINHTDDTDDENDDKQLNDAPEKVKQPEEELESVSSSRMEGSTFER